MPLTDKSYSGDILPGVLRQNLPEGFLEGWLHQHFGKTMKLDDFHMLALTGRDMIGRVTVAIEDEKEVTVAAGESLSELLAWKGTEALFEHLVQKYAAMSGISGVQPKVLLREKADTSREVVEKVSIRDRHLIVKAAGDDFPGLAENEYHCMTIAKQAGLTVPQFWLSDDKGLFVATRFDRDSSGNYLGFEDMTALTGRQNAEKYGGSYEMIARVVEQFTSAVHTSDSMAELFKSIVLSVVVRNGDAHLKNFGLLYTTPHQSDIRLSPLFDVVNTTCYLPKDVLAVNLAKTKSWPYRKELVEFGKRICHVDRAADVIDLIADAAATYVPGIETGGVWPIMKKEIERGCASVISVQVAASGM